MVCHHLRSTPGQEVETYDGLQGDGRWLALCNNNGHTASACYQRLFQDEVHIRHFVYRSYVSTFCPYSLIKNNTAFRELFPFCSDKTRGQVRTQLAPMESVIFGTNSIHKLDLWTFSTPWINSRSLVIKESRQYVFVFYFLRSCDGAS